MIIITNRRLQHLLLLISEPVFFLMQLDKQCLDKNNFISYTLTYNLGLQRLNHHEQTENHQWYFHIHDTSNLFFPETLLLLIPSIVTNTQHVSLESCIFFMLLNVVAFLHASGTNDNTWF